MISYVIFIRILSQEYINIDNIKDAQIIINELIVEYEYLYEVKSMSSNVHGHLHLPQQVLDFGPLQKTSAYIFENMFKMTMNKYFGTRNFEGQVANNLQISKIIKSDIIDLKKKSNSQINFFINKHFSMNNLQVQDILFRPQTKKLKYFKEYEIVLFKKFKFETDCLIEYSHRAMIN